MTTEIKKRTFLGELIARYKSDTPGFWKRVAASGGTLVVIGTGFLAIPAVTFLGGYLVTAGSVIVVLAGAGTKTPEQVKYKVETTDESK